MRFMILPIAAASLAASAVPALSQSVAEATANLNLRAGPGSSYPVVTTIPHGGNVRVYGCVKGYNWCDVTYRNIRGWVYSAYLDYRYQGRRGPIARVGPSAGLPIITFSFGNYSRRHYHGRRYDDVNRWYDRHHRGDRHDGRRGRDRDDRWDRDRDRDRDRDGRRGDRDDFRRLLRECQGNPNLDCPEPVGRLN